MIRTLIVDDEPVARRRLKRLLQSEADVEIVGEAGDGRAAADGIRALRPDLVFLDVQMPEIDGFGVLRLAGDPMPAVVFVTAFDQYALAAFEVHALDYLLKPFGRDRLASTLVRVRRHLVRADDDRLRRLLSDVQGPRRYLSRFVVRGDSRVRLIEASRVDWIEAADNYVVLHVGSDTHAVRETMTRLAAELDPERFVRIHRSTIVQLDRIAELRPSFHGDFVVSLKDGTRVNMSRAFRQHVEAVLGRPL
jgi:two-component system, LytTR family, response regulator